MDFNINQKIALAVIIGIVLIGLSIFGSGWSGGRSESIEISEPSITADGDQVSETGTESIGGPLISNRTDSCVVVHVAGEVNKPDVYTLPQGSRVIDAIRKAGGATQSGNTDALNLAAQIRDGEKITVPPKGGVPITINFPPGVPVRVPASSVNPSTTPSAVNLPSMPISSAGEQSSTSTGKLKNPGDGTVNINTADLTELQRLPGVGPSTAQKILEHRNQIGRFSIPDQLMDVKGIGPKKFEKMRPFITL